MITQSENIYTQQRSAKLQTLVAAKQQFVPQNMMESNWETVVAYYIELLQGGSTSLSDTAVNELYNIAIMCPYTAGTAVYKARALLNALDMGVWANDEEICENLAFKTGQDNPLKELAKKGWKREYLFKVFPNPAREILNLTYLIGDNKNISVAVINVLGQEVIGNKQLNIYGADVLNTSELTSGVYFLKIYDSQRLLETKKILIEK